MNNDESAWVDSRATFVCGIDEVGRGSLAGPVAASAVILPRNIFIPGLNDSKKLSPDKRSELFPIILNSALSIGIGYVDAFIIDRWGINCAVVEAMYRAIACLSIIPEWVLVDGFLIPYLPFRQTAIKGGDGLSQSIAAASVVAKVLRDRVMEFYDFFYPQYGFCKNKGYGTAEHIGAIMEYGPSPVHRMTFKPINELQR